MATPRTRRLNAEHQEMSSLAEASSLVSFTTEGMPPTRYVVTLSCRGLQPGESGPEPLDRHVFDLLLEGDFPSLSPTINWRTAIFHPNFKQPSVCLGDLWYPAWSIAEMCVALCEMVQYKRFNIYDPLNTEAARWLVGKLEESPQDLPVDPRPVRDVDFEISRAPSTPVQDHS